METLKAISSGLAFSPTVFLMQLGLFILLLLVMNSLLWKPVLAHLKQRDDEITGAYKHRDDLQHEMERLRTDYLTRLAQIEAEARSHIQSAVKEAQDERERLLAEARANAENTLKTGIADLEVEMTRALGSMRDNMVGLAADAASRALGGAVGASQLRASAAEKLNLEMEN